MDETWMLLLLVIVMLVGSYLAGNIPLVVTLSEEKLKNVSIFGAGLLVGTALTVIIPEGIRSLYDESKLEAAAAKETSDAPGHKHSDDEHSSAIGLSLVLGFVFMMLVDQVSSRRKESSNERNLTATIGLVVHAAADGVALGAAATTSHSDVEIIVFLAIMLHKAPAAFGLVSFLLHEGIERQRIRKHLLIFSLRKLWNRSTPPASRCSSPPGTFLYVATVHVLPELTHNTGGAHGGHRGHDYSLLEQAGGKPPVAPNGLKNSELCLLILGALAPLFLTIGHHH
ncbi:hypothetical protein quinque_010092 [Culex quinquefasciatus]